MTVQTLWHPLYRWTKGVAVRWALEGSTEVEVPAPVGFSALKEQSGDLGGLWAGAVPKLTASCGRLAAELPLEASVVWSAGRCVEDTVHLDWCTFRNAGVGSSLQGLECCWFLGLAF